MRILPNRTRRFPCSIERIFTDGRSSGIHYARGAELHLTDTASRSVSHSCRHRQRLCLKSWLAIWLGEDVRRLYLEHGLHLETYQGNDTWLLPIPATFVVGRNGRIIDRFVDPDFRNRMDIADILSALNRSSV